MLHVFSVFGLNWQEVRKKEGRKEKKSILIYGTFENSSIALDSSTSCKEREGLSDGLRKEHLIQSGDDIKKCCVYGYARTKPKIEIVAMKESKMQERKKKKSFGEIILFHSQDM